MKKLNKDSDNSNLLFEEDAKMTTKVTAGVGFSRASTGDHIQQERSTAQEENSN